MRKSGRNEPGGRRESKARAAVPPMEGGGLFQAIFERAGIGIALVDMSGRIVKSNPALREMLGYGESELRGLSISEVTHPDDVDKGLELFGQVVRREREYYRVQKRYVCKGGRVIWGNLTASVVYQPEGDPQFVVGMVEDVTELKRDEELLGRAHDELQALICQKTQRLGEVEGELKAEAAQRRQAQEVVAAIRGVLGAGASAGEGASRAPAPQAAPLTRREAEVLRLIARGFGVKEIASRLNLSVKTVDTHRQRLMKKLNLRSRAEVVRYAMGMGWMHGE